MNKIGICGRFNFHNHAHCGQTIKTRIIGQVLSDIFGSEQVIYLDTANWKKKKLKFLFQCIKLAYNSEHIIILPAQNGIKILIPLFVYLSKLFNRKLHYIIIGAWLADSLKKYRYLIKLTKKINYIYSETNTLIKKLNELGISDNIFLMPNFKTVDPISIDFEKLKYKKPYKLCIMSRINYNKGIESAIKVVDRLNRNYGKKIVELDIYGPIEDSYIERFKELVQTYSAFIKYKGVVDYKETINVLKDYYLLLFPTKYYTEGFPGTILDAYFSGVPVVASKWESWTDVIEDKYTGYSYEFNNEYDFYKTLYFLIQNENIVIEMKKNCLEVSKKYKANNAIKVLIDNIS